jgi:cysteinyl-tRNA synthetase
MLHLHNTLSRKKEAFEPLVAGKVSMYVCGITIYDLCHVGHARLLVAFDLLYRHLLASDYDVTYVRNITDIDDKIINRATENGESINELTERYIAAMHEDEASLLLKRPTHEPRATNTIGKMHSLINTLIEKDMAYPAANGDVYYSVSSFPDYGKLSGRKLDDLRAGERVALDENKRDPLDFVLWKASKEGEPAWDSDWGPGRPGWHIECSAMAIELLGEEIDIHGGGADLQFPHHENEIAQSEAATGKTFARYWMHNGLVQVDDEKMSKSLHNFFTVREVLKKYSGEELRYFLLSGHYRSPLNYSQVQLDNARAALRRLYTALRGSSADTNGAVDNTYIDRFHTAMDDDLNTPVALAVMFDLATELNRAGGGATEKGAPLANTLMLLGERLGLLQADVETVLQGSVGEDGFDAAKVDELIEERVTARANKDWARSDEIRDELAALGVILEDKDGKTSWRRG